MDEQTAQTLRNAEQLLQAGKRQAARPLLAAALQRDPASVQAWWLLSQAVEDAQQERDCLERLLRLDPAHAPARARLEQLKAPPPFVFPDAKPAQPEAQAEAPDLDLSGPWDDLSQPDWVSRPATEPSAGLRQARPAQDPTPAVEAPASEAESSEVPAWAEPPLPSQKNGSPVARPARKKHSWIVDAVIIGIILCLLLSVVAFFALQNLGRSLMQNVQETQAVEQALTSRPPQSLPPTWTSTLTPSPIPSRTPTPTATFTPTLLYTLTPTPIPTWAFGLATGKFPPDFTLTELSSGAQVSLSDYEGQAVLLFFWATWCPYCDNEIPHLQDIYEAYQAQGLVVLAINEGEAAAEVESYRARRGLTFPILLDAEFEVTRLYAANSIPQHVFIGRSGRIFSIVTGGLGYATLENNVRNALRVYPTSTP